MQTRRIKRSGGRAARREAVVEGTATPPVPTGGLRSGSLSTLSDAERLQIHHAALEVLETVGVGEAPDHTRAILVEAGCNVSDQGRICFPSALVEDTVTKANRSLVLHGQHSDRDLELSGSRTYFSTGCGSVKVVDPASKSVRPMRLRDVYDFARIADLLEHIHMVHRLGIPTDIEDTGDVDINLCYACVRGTSKPVSSSWFDGDNVRRSIEMLHHIAGGEDKWRERPFVSNVCCYVVPPLRFAEESCLGLEHAVRGGMPVQLTSSGQQGATAPVSMAGNIVQTVAETLAGLVYAYAVSPDARVILGMWPLVCDLRTGAAAPGSPEQALVSSAACQMARYYEIPNGCVSGITDSKLPDTQSAMEKALQHAIVANSGGNIMLCAAGALAGGLGASHAGLVIDNEIAGMALRTVAGFEVNETELAVEQIRQTCTTGPGHYLERVETLARMKADFFYPRFGDRSSLNDWVESGGTTILDNATAFAEQTMKEHYPDHVSPLADSEVRRRFNILLPAEDCAGSQ